MCNLCKAPYICKLRPADHCRKTELSRKLVASKQCTISTYSQSAEQTWSNSGSAELLHGLLNSRHKCVVRCMHLQDHSVQLCLWDSPALAWCPLAHPRSCIENLPVNPGFHVGSYPIGHHAISILACYGWLLSKGFFCKHAAWQSWTCMIWYPYGLNAWSDIHTLTIIKGSKT